MPPSLYSCIYEVQVLEHCPIGFQAAIVSARDLDIGTNGETSYVFSQAPEDICKTFRKMQIREKSFNTRTGFLIYTDLYIKYSGDRWWGLFWKLCGACSSDGFESITDHINSFQWNPRKFAGDRNCCIQRFTLTRDNGRMACSIQEDLPFNLKPSVKNFYTLVTNTAPDRKARSEYNITITVTDMATPRLKTRVQHNRVGVWRQWQRPRLHPDFLHPWVQK